MQRNRRTFLDSCTVIAAFKTTRPFHEKAIALLRDDTRDFLATSLVELELSQPQHFEEGKPEADFYTDYLENIVTERMEITEAVIASGIDMVKRTGERPRLPDHPRISIAGPRQM